MTTLSVCFNEITKNIIRNEMVNTHAIDPLFNFMRGNSIHKEEVRVGAGCYVKYHNITVPNPVVGECCDINGECFEPPKELQFVRPSCNNFAFKSTPIELPLIITRCYPKEADFFGLLSARVFITKFANKLISMMWQYAMNAMYQDVLDCDDAGGSKAVDFWNFAKGEKYTLPAGGLKRKNLIDIASSFHDAPSDITADGFFVLLPQSYYSKYMDSVLNNVNCCDFTIQLPDGSTRKSNNYRLWMQDPISGVVLISVPDKYFKVDSSNKPLIPFGAWNGLDIMMKERDMNGLPLGMALSHPQVVSFGNISISWAGTYNDLVYDMVTRLLMRTYFTGAYLEAETLSWLIGDTAITPNAGVYTGATGTPIQLSDMPFFMNNGATDTVTLNLDDTKKKSDEKLRSVK